MGERQNTTKKLGLALCAGMTIYAAVQVLTGVEIGVLAAGLVLTQGWELPTALAWSLPLGIPLALAQAAVLGALSTWRYNRPIPVAD